MKIWVKHISLSTLIRIFCCLYLSVSATIIACMCLMAVDIVRGGNLFHGIIFTNITFENFKIQRLAITECLIWLSGNVMEKYIAKTTDLIFFSILNILKNWNISFKVWNFVHFFFLLVEGDHSIHCCWDLIRSKQLSTGSVYRAQVFAGFSGHGN